MPANLDMGEFREAWGEWQQHRREIKKAMTPTAARQQLAKLAEMGPQRAVAALKHSMANGWQGVFEPQSGQRKGHDGNTTRKAITDDDHKRGF